VVVVPVPKGVAPVLKFAARPEVESNESPVAVVAGVTPAITTEPTMVTPVAGELLSIL
jgi:hypothetical protein